MTVLERNARVLREAFTRCLYSATGERSDAYARDVAKRIGANRIQLHRHLLAVLFDAYTRHAPREAVEAYARALLAIVGSWYDVGASLTDDELLALVRRETIAQGGGDLAEMELSLARTPKSISDAAEALDRHLVTLEDLSAALHARKVA